MGATFPAPQVLAGQAREIGVGFGRTGAVYAGHDEATFGATSLGAVGSIGQYRE
jgi:hypothetical protein